MFRAYALNLVPSVIKAWGLGSGNQGRTHIGLRKALAKGCIPNRLQFFWATANPVFPATETMMLVRGLIKHTL